MSNETAGATPKMDALNNLSPAKRALLERRLAARAQQPDGSAIPPRPAAAVVPLTPGQRMLWLFDRVAAGRTAYNMPDVWRLKGAISHDALQRALNAVVARHEALRTVIGGAESDPVQVPQRSATVPLVVHDLRGLEPAERESRVAAAVADATQRAFDLTRDVPIRAALIQLPGDESVFVLVLHHIAADGWSRRVVLRDLAVAYAQAARGGSPTLVPPPIQFADYATWLAAHLDTPEIAVHLAYWRERLATPRPVLELPTDRPRERARTGAGGMVRCAWSRGLADEINAFAREHRVTPFMVLLAAWQVVLARHAGQDDIIVGTPVAGRGRSELDEVVGYFASTVPMRTSLAGNPSFLDVVGRVRTTVLDGFEHQEVPLEAMLPGTGANGEDSSLFRVLFALQNYERAVLAIDGVAVIPEPPSEVAARVDLTLGMVEREDGFRLALEYSTELFDRTTVERLLSRFECFVRGAVASPESSIFDLTITPAAERHQLARYNATTVSWLGAPRTLPAGIAAQARQTPDAVAVAADGKQLTYAELDAHARQLADRLRDAGVGPNVLVGVCLERSLELMIALVAVLYSGGAYVPLDPEYPADRLGFMASDAGFPVVLTQSRFHDRVPAPQSTIVIDVTWEGTEQGAPRVQSAAPIACPEPDDLAYMIYTSGSTGQPKGALNTHRGIVNRLLWMQGTYALTAADVVLQKTPISFDVSVPELFAPLLFGATILMAEPGGHRDPAYLAEAIIEHGVTLAHFVPSMLRVFLGEPRSAACSALRHVTCSGEALPLELTERFFATLPHTRLHNLYGPTEAAVEVSHWECRPESRERSVPIGAPAANTQLYVLDERQHVVPIGVEGELYIGGVQVGAGYHGRPALTAERFLPDPFRPGVPGARLYRTGDRARWRGDGVLEYLGRRDGQIKLRGFRIELGEIETALRRVPGVLDAAVIVRPDPGGSARLIGYYVPSSGNTDVSDLIAPRARDELSRVLPEFMVPAAFVGVSALPLMPSGKLDRDALPSPPSLEAPGAQHIVPRSAAEAVVADIWSATLGHGDFGVTTRFFAVGGHSLLAARVVGQVNRIFRSGITLRQFFETATIGGVVESLVAQESKPGQTEAIAQLLRQVQSMSRDERARARGDDNAANRTGPV